MFTGALVADVSLPARSRTDAPAVRPVPSPLMVLSAGAAPSMPDRLSPAVHFTVTSPLYQSARLWSVVGDPVRVGAVLSTSIGPTVTSSVLPASSVAVPF